MECQVFDGMSCTGFDRFSLGHLQSTLPFLRQTANSSLQDGPLRSLHMELWSYGVHGRKYMGFTEVISPLYMESMLVFAWLFDANGKSEPKTSSPKWWGFSW